VDLGRLVGPDCRDAEAVVVRSGVEGADRLGPLPRHAGTHGEAEAVACEERDEPTGSGCAGQGKGSGDQRREVHGDTVAAHHVVAMSVLVAEGQEVADLEAHPASYLVALLGCHSAGCVEQID